MTRSLGDFSFNIELPFQTGDSVYRAFLVGRITRHFHHCFHLGYLTIAIMSQRSSTSPTIKPLT